MFNHQSWTILTLSVIVLCLLAVAGFNYYIDPLWNFSHTNRLNTIQASFDERQQKTNFITNNAFNKKSLLIGSSRVTYFNQKDFGDYDVYNYGVSNIILDDYNTYIEHAKEVNGKDFDYIFLGLDFYATNINAVFSDFKEPSFYIDKSESWSYPYTSLLSFDTTKYAWDNYQNAKLGVKKNFHYDRNNIKTLNREKEIEVTWSRIYATVDKYRKDIYANYEYDRVYEKLAQIKENNPNTQFIVFTTPVSQPLFELIGQQDLTKYYDKWLDDIVSVYGEVHHFMYINSVTADPNNFYDGSHVYPEVTTLVAHKLINAHDNNVPKDFGLVIN